MQREVEQFGDIVFVKEKTNYKSILYKSYYVLEYAISHYNARFILKSDDDAFVNVAALVHQLRQLCQSEVGPFIPPTPPNARARGGATGECLLAGSVTQGRTWSCHVESTPHPYQIDVSERGRLEALARNRT